MKTLNKDLPLSSSSKRIFPYTLYCLRSLIKTELNNKSEFTLLNSGCKTLRAPYASFKGDKYRTQSHSKQIPTIKCPIRLSYQPAYTTNTTNEVQCNTVQSFEFIPSEKKKTNTLTVSFESSFGITKNNHSSIKKELDDNVNLSRTNTRRSTLKTSCCLKSSKELLPKKKTHHFICEAKAKVKKNNKNIKIIKSEKRMTINNNVGRNTFLQKHSTIYRNLTSSIE